MRAFSQPESTNQPVTIFNIGRSEKTKSRTFGQHRTEPIHCSAHTIIMERLTTPGPYNPQGVVPGQNTLIAAPPGCQTLHLRSYEQDNSPHNPLLGVEVPQVE